MQLEHGHAFDDAVARVAVEQAASRRRPDAVTLQDGVVDVSTSAVRLSPVSTLGNAPRIRSIATSVA